MSNWKSKLWWAVAPKSVKEDYKKLVEDNQNFVDQLTEQAIYRAELVGDLTSLEKKLAESEQESYWSSERINDLEYKVQDLLQEVSELESEIDDLNHQLQELNYQLEGY